MSEERESKKGKLTQEEVEAIRSSFMELIRQRNLTPQTTMRVMSLLLKDLWGWVEHPDKEDKEWAIDRCNEFFEQVHKSCLQRIKENQERETKGEANE